MKFEELRIGNVLNMNGFSSVLLRHDFSIYEPDTISPVPLKNIWLVTFGFKKYHRDIPTWCKEFGDYVDNDYEYSFNIYQDADKKYYVVIFGKKIILKFVHQLQNLYFALTGEELEVQGKYKL